MLLSQLKKYHQQNPHSPTTWNSWGGAYGESISVRVSLLVPHNPAPQLLGAPIFSGIQARALSPKSPQASLDPYCHWSTPSNSRSHATPHFSRSAHRAFRRSDSGDSESESRPSLPTSRRQPHHPDTFRLCPHSQPARYHRKQILCTSSWPESRRSACARCRPSSC
jgi:hypothetical protein